MWLERDLIHEYDRQRLAEETRSYRLLRQAGMIRPGLHDHLLLEIGEALIATGTRLKKMSELTNEAEINRPLAKNAA